MNIYVKSNVMYNNVYRVKGSYQDIVIQEIAWNNIIATASFIIAYPNNIELRTGNLLRYIKTNVL